MRRKNMLRNREAQAIAARRARTRLIHAIETLPQVRQMFRRDANASILHRQMRLPVAG
jgi:hypothetical protein